MQQKTVKIGDIEIGENRPIAFITGPCQLENRDHAMMMADKISNLCAKNGAQFIFKASYDKANRSSISSARGIGMDEGLRILNEIGREFSCPVITDVHEASQCQAVSEAVDILQIPAFLCRQTDLLLAAGKTGKPINVKKGQFMAPWDMWNVAEKIASTGNRDILLCERAHRLDITLWSMTFAAYKLWQKRGIRLFLTPPIRCSNPADKAIHRAVSGSSWPDWPALPVPWASAVFLLKPIKTLIMPPAMAQT
jgi:hypothetical protein